MELSLFTYPEFFKGEADILNEAMDNYPFTLHLRKPAASEYEYESLFKSINPKHYHRVILHNAFKLKDTHRVLGIHLNKRYLMGGLKGIGIRTTSCHSLNEFTEIDGKFDYAFISPIYKSISKLGYLPAIEHNTLRSFLEEKHATALIALGGIDQNTIQQAMLLGFKHAAVLGFVWSNQPENKEKVMSRLKSLYK